MKRRRWFQSTIARAVTIIIVLVLPINIITLLLSARMLNNSRQQMEQEIQSTLTTNTEALKAEIVRTTRSLVNLVVDQPEFIELSQKKEGNSEKGLLVITAKQQLKRMKQGFEWIDLLYAGFPENEYIITSGHTGINYNQCRELIKNASAENSNSDAEHLYRWNWDMMELEDTPILFCIRNWRNVDVGCIINLERLLYKLNLDKPAPGRTIFFTDSKHAYYTESGTTLLTELGVSLEELEQDSGYGVYYEELPEYDLCLVEVVDWSQQGNYLPTYIILMGSISVLMAILALPIILLCFRRWISKPIVSLTKAMDQIEQGNLEYRIEIPDKEESMEFDQIKQNFNNMMEQVTELKIDVYENELEKNNIKMKYLSQQIQPHFILNAMNILYSYEPEEYELSQKMIQCISKYFRHIVKANEDFVCLYQEMEHIQNYFEIQKARFPELFFAVVEYEEELKDALIPPLILQNFAENAIKHSLKIGKNIAIYVVAEKMIEQGEAKIRIRFADTGDGISDEVLEQIEVFRATGVWQPDLGVGIQNTIERLRYLYADQGRLMIGRDSHYSGTNVELILPLHYRKEGGRK